MSVRLEKIKIQLEDGSKTERKPNLLKISDTLTLTNEKSKQEEEIINASKSTIRFKEDKDMDSIKMNETS
jgi:hypothetical protein